MFPDILLTTESFGSLIVSFDKELLLAVNGSESLYLDRAARLLTAGLTWLPLYISLFYVVLNNNENFRKVLLILCGAGLCVLLAGTFDDAIVKPGIARWRPTRDPEIGLLVDIVDGYRGGRYGFFSAHASNTFSIAVFFCWLVRSRLLSTALVIWSFINCWTRLYLGVHFPGDIVAGLIWGGLVGTAVYFLYARLSRGMVSGKRFVSTQYTVTGYQRSDCDKPVAVLVLTLVFVLIMSCFV